MKPKRSPLIDFFAQHKVAANLLMMLMLIGGVFALQHINVQTLPNFETNWIEVTIVWPGASAEDVENSVTNAVEKYLSDLTGIKEMTSISQTGRMHMFIELKEGTNLAEKLENIRSSIEQIRNLPTDAERPIVLELEHYDDIARMVVSGPASLDELRPLIHRFERQLLDLGISQIDILGLPEQELAIQIPSQTLADIRLSLPAIARLIAERSVDLPAGKIGKYQAGRQLRSLAQQRDPAGFANLPILNDEQGQLVRLGDIATIDLQPQEGEILVFYNGKPAVEMRLLRNKASNTLKSAHLFNTWLTQTQAQLGESVDLHVYQERWQFVKERIQLLLKNGAGGLLLIIILLFLALNRHVAFWIIVGIPTSFLAAIFVLYLVGGAIDMVTLFAFIMSLGIIVDDTIVVGEQTITNLNRGDSPLNAVRSAASKMAPPVIASSLTTVFAFLPLAFISDVLGKIIFFIPVVVICVIITSLIECFLVLPEHLYSGLKNYHTRRPGRLHTALNQAFDSFRRRYYRAAVIWALRHRALVLSASYAIFLICVGLVTSGYINFTFFPEVESQTMIVKARFTLGTPSKEIKSFLDYVERQVNAIDEEVNDGKQPIVQTTVQYQNYSQQNEYVVNKAEHHASLTIELASSDRTGISTTSVMRQLRDRIILPPSVDSFSIYMPEFGPPGQDIDILLTGTDTPTLKAAAVELKQALTQFTGVSDVYDDLPYGQEQMIYRLNEVGESLGLTIQEVGDQLRAAFSGEIAQIYNLPDEEIEVRVMLPNHERFNLATLDYYPIITANREVIPLTTIVNLSYRQAPDLIVHNDTKLSVRVFGAVDTDVNNISRILQNLNQNFLPQLAQRYNINYRFKGRAEEQATTFVDMRYALLLGLALIYITLAWVFSSYLWPLIIMLTVPLGLTGAILGHLLMGIDLTIFSLFGLFGLSGIVINDSIILINEFKHIMHNSRTMQIAILNACCDRLRPVLLTSLTTILGLTPLLFETSLQAQFLIPMAVSIVFGLMASTVLILLVVPTLLALFQSGVKRWQRG
jgi:multidrug efflux pump subunit AcrB